MRRNLLLRSRPLEREPQQQATQERRQQRRVELPSSLPNQNKAAQDQRATTNEPVAHMQAMSVRHAIPAVSLDPTCGLLYDLYEHIHVFNKC